jgi:hypothetical protein
MALDDYALTTVADANQFLGLTADGGSNDNFIEVLVHRATDIIENYCQRKFVGRLYAKERHNGTGQNIVYFKNAPVVSVCLDELVWDSTAGTVTRDDGGSFIDDGFSTDNNKILIQNSDSNSGLLTLTTVAASSLTFSSSITSDTEDNDVTISNVRSLWVGDDEIDEDNFDVFEDHIYYSPGFSEGHGNIKLTYYGGYATIPDDLEHACLQIVESLYNGNENVGNIQSESLGDHSITYAGGSGGSGAVMSSIQAATKHILDKYKKVAV